MTTPNAVEHFRAVQTEMRELLTDLALLENVTKHDLGAQPNHFTEALEAAKRRAGALAVVYERRLAALPPVPAE